MASQAISDSRSISIDGITVRCEGVTGSGAAWLEVD